MSNILHLFSRLRNLRRRASLHETSGATAIEFAILAPVFILLIMGLVETGIILFVRSAMEASMVDGARMMIMNPNLSREQFMRQEVSRMTGHIVDPNRLVITTQTFGAPGASSASPGAVMVYRVSYPWHIITPMLQRLMGDANQNIQIVSVSMTRNRPR